jgi:chloramphenicol 3-O-phosphotransferase
MQQVSITPFVIFDEPEHIGTVQTEFLIWRDRAPTLHRGYLDAIAALARAGNRVALSAAGHRQAEFLDAFDDVPIFSVGLTCELSVLVERERRSGRWAGIAAESLGVHDGWIYDVEFDTTYAPDPLELARIILGDR